MSPETIARIEGEQTRLRLARHPELQAEALAHHYTRLAALSGDLLYLVRLQKYYKGRNESAEESIERLMKVIQETHLKDLGIPLEWKCDETLYRDSRLTSDDKSVE